eukprot:1161664-Pelagomonas_calceolata.AAC.28
MLPPQGSACRDVTCVFVHLVTATWPHPHCARRAHAHHMHAETGNTHICAPDNRHGRLLTVHGACAHHTQAMCCWSPSQLHHLQQVSQAWQHLMGVGCRLRKRLLDVNGHPDLGCSQGAVHRHTVHRHGGRQR